jgi:hypothetical protein
MAAQKVRHGVIKKCIASPSCRHQSRAEGTSVITREELVLCFHEKERSVRCSGLQLR